MKYVRYSLWLLLVAGLLTSTGCPRRPAPDLDIDEDALNIEPDDDSGTLNIGNSGGGEIEWSVDADVDWISFSANEGTGEAEVEVNIDRSLLAPLSISRGNITITSSGGTTTIPVVVPSLIAGLGADYLPLAIGNVWNFTLPSLLPEGPGEDTKLLKSLFKQEEEEPDPVVLRLEVTGQRTVNTLTVWEIQASMPNLAVPAPGGTMKQVDNTFEVMTYWVNVDGLWHITLREGLLDSLPEVSEFIPFVELVKLPGKIEYLVYSARLQTLADDISEVLADTDELASALMDDVLEFLGALFVDTDEDGEADSLDLSPLFPLLNAFGAAFDAYPSDNALLADLIELLADTASAAEPLDTFVRRVIEIVNDVAEQLDALYPEDRQKQGAEQTAGRLLAEFYDADADEDGLLTLAEAQTILPELTQAEFNQCEVHVDGLLSETELQIVAYGDPASYAALIDWLTGFHEEFAAYTNPDPLIQSVVRTLGVSANQVAIFLDAGLGYSYADRDAIEAFLNDLNTFVFGDDSAVPQETISALKALDPKTIAKAVLDGYTGLEPEDIDEILEHIDVYATDNAAVEQVKEAAAAILIQAREIVVVLKTYELQDFAAANLRAFSTALAAYADDFAAAHPDVVGAQAAAIAAHAFDDIVEALEVLEPAVDEVVDDMVQLLEDLDNPDESILDPATYETAFGDLAEFFEDYADTTDHGDDALADLIAVYLRGLEEIAGLLVALDVELDALAYAEMQGALSELLPDWPMDITLDAFGIGEQADCLAAQVTIPEPVEEEQSKQDEPVEHVVSMTIFAKDVGPALYGPLTLFSATIDGVELGGKN